MAFYDKFPYTNFQELNLDWITQEVSKVRDNRDASDASAAAALASEKAAKASETAAAASQQAAANSETAATESAAGIEAARKQIYINTARLDNLIVDGTKTEGNSELLDIRVGCNGVTYPTAGDAVRGQYTELNQAIDEIREPSYNLVEGIIEGKNIDADGVISDDSGYNLFYFPVTPGETYTIQTDDGLLVGGYFTDKPKLGSKTADGTRITGNDYTITAKSTGYFSFRSHSTFTEGQAVSGTEEKPYQPHYITVDRTARRDITTINSEIEILNDRTEKRTYDLYSGLTAKDTYSPYAGSDFYTVCDVRKNTRINSIDLLGTSGRNSSLAIVYYDNGTLTLEKLITLPNATGLFQSIPIDYITKHDGFVALGYTFGYAVSTVRKKKATIFKITGTTITNVQTATAAIEYTCSIHTESVPIIGIDVKQISSDISMFENIGFCGDSYMTGLIVISENPTVTKENHYLSWPKVLERTHGIHAYVYAEPGVKASNYVSHPNCLPKLVSESAKQLYVVSLGHNDASNRTPVSDFKTAYRTILDGIIAHAPNAKIIICRQSNGYGDMNNGAELNVAISELGEEYSVPVLNPEDDIYLSSNIYVETQVHRHPVFSGYAGIAKAFDRLFSKATVDYFDYFKEYTGL